MHRILPVFLFIFLINILSSPPILAQPAKPLAAPKDKFSKAFLKIYKEAPAQFIKVKGKKAKTGNTNSYTLKNLLPGSKAGYLVKGDSSYCIFKFDTYNVAADAEDEMTKLSVEVKNALQMKTMIKNIDSSHEQNVEKQTAIAEVKDGGFYGYNILVSLLKDDNDQKYTIQLKIKGGKGILYRPIYKNEPVRSSLFKTTFDKMYTQFNSSDNYYCNELLPGFDCSMTDSSGKEQLMMEKPVTDFPDARVQFEALATNLRAILGDKFLYYISASSNQLEREIVFIRASDFEQTERKSISAYLLKSDEGFSVKVIMYHP